MAVNCWDILRFVSDSFFFLSHSLVVCLLPVEAVRELRTREKDKDSFRFNFFYCLFISF